MNPIHARYQTAPHPDDFNIILDNLKKSNKNAVYFEIYFFVPDALSGTKIINNYLFSSEKLNSKPANKSPRVVVAVFWSTHS